MTVRHRIRSRLVVVFMAAAAPAAAAQEQPKPNAVRARDSGAIDAATRSAVLAARDAIWRAWFAHDSAALSKLLPRATAAGDANGWESREEIIEGSRRSAASGQTLVGLTFDDTRIHTSGAVAVVFSNYTLELERQGQRRTVTGAAAEVFVLRNGIWQNPFWYLGER